MTSRITTILMLAALPALAAAATASFEFTADNAAVVDHWPGLDGMVGNADDLIGSTPSPIEDSAPNPGSYSYNAFDFGSGVTEDGLPDGFNAITFIAGSVEIDLDVAANGSAELPVVTALSVTSGTEPFPGHGPFTAEFTNVTGAYDVPTRGLTLNVDFAADLGGTPDTALNMKIVGQAWVIEDKDFGTATGNAYVDDVVVPLAQAEGATRVAWVMASGLIPLAENFSWGPMPFVASIVALDDSDVARDDATWGAVKALYGSR